MKKFFNRLGERLEKTLFAMLKPTFITWYIVLRCVINKKLDIPPIIFIAFTCAIIGIKQWQKMIRK